MFGQKKDDHQPKLSELDEHILSLLEEKGEMTGFQLTGALEEKGLGHRPDKVYPALNMLKKKGYVSDRWEELEDPEAVRLGARRRYYRISDGGKRGLAKCRNLREEESVLDWGSGLHPA
jgi:DNA-binding PadR family transcriptional regulator